MNTPKLPKRLNRATLLELFEHLANDLRKDVGRYSFGELEKAVTQRTAEHKAREGALRAEVGQLHDSLKKALDKNGYATEVKLLRAEVTKLKHQLNGVTHERDVLRGGFKP